MTFNWGQRPRKLNVIRVSKRESVDLWREGHPGWSLPQEKAFTGTTLSSLNSVNLTFLSWLVIYFLKVSLTSLRLPLKAMKWVGLGHTIHCPDFDHFGCFAGFNNVQKISNLLGFYILSAVTLTMRYSNGLVFIIGITLRQFGSTTHGFQLPVTEPNWSKRINLWKGDCYVMITWWNIEKRSISLVLMPGKALTDATD